MKWKQKRLARLAIAATVGALVWWASDKWLASEPPVNGQSGKEADYIIENFSATRLNKLGKPQHQLNALSYHYYSGIETARLVLPRLVQYDENRQATYTRANKGQLDTRNKTLRMVGNVEVRSGAQKDRGPVQLRTNELVVELE